MEIVTIALIIIAVNIIITTLIFDYFVNLIVDNFNIQDEFNNTIVKHISSIYDIIKHNGLTRPKKESK